MYRVNYIRHQKAFYSHVRKDNRLKANDISLYLALFQIWNNQHFRNRFPIIREEVMLLSRIGSRNTYTNCLKWLHTCGYIIYQPSNRPYVPSLVSIVPFTGKSTKQLTLFDEPNPKRETRTKLRKETHTRLKKETPTCPKIDTTIVPKMRHNYNKQINNQTESKSTRSKKNSIINEKKTPTIEAAMDWFSQRGHPPQEARKFFYHYQAIDWMLSGHPIADWQAAAAKWSENIKTTKHDKHDKPGKLHTDNNKAYTHPL
ncbi:hypothetical protein BW716_15615 [[Flexibacter] sp. ATCC 35208]|nr:hypothetical protein BW716_15615 [[Flexibacter] sp. ATCC 35208]